MSINIAIKKLSIILSLICISIGYSQNSNLKGTVVQDENDYLLPDSTIYLISKNNDTISTRTDYSGRYSFNEIKNGEYKLRLYNDNPGREILDTIVKISSSDSLLKLRMKIFQPHVWEKTTFFELKFGEVPSSTFNYEYIIKQDSIILNQRDKHPLKKVNKSYSYALTEIEKIKLDSLFKSNKLNIPSTYEKRAVIFFRYWNISFDYQSVNFNIKLPNYHNQGLEDLLEFVSNLIPKKEKLDLTR